MDAVLNYFKEAYRELELVRWPTRQQAIRLSVIVIGFTIANGLAFGGIDLGLSKALYLFLTSLI